MSQSGELREAARRLNRIADELEQQEQTRRYILSQAEPSPCGFERAFRDLERKS